MPVFWNWLESNSWRLTLGFATDSADAKRVLCSVQRLQFLCVELHFSPWTEWKMLATFKKISLRDLQCCVIKMTIYYFSQVLSPFLPVLTLGFCKALSPLLQSFIFFLLKCLHCAEIWDRAKLWPSATTGFIHFMQLCLSCLTVISGGQIPLGGAKAVNPVQNNLLEVHCTLIPQKRSWSSVQIWLNEKSMPFLQWWYFLRS